MNQKPAGGMRQHGNGDRKEARDVSEHRHAPTATDRQKATPGGRKYAPGSCLYDRRQACFELDKLHTVHLFSWYWICTGSLKEVATTSANT